MSQLNLTSWQRRRLRRQLSATENVRLFRRTLAVLEFDHGRPAADSARMLGVTRQTVYNWVEAYTSAADPTALEDHRGHGHLPLLDEDAEHFLESLRATSPQEFDYPHVDWTVPLLLEALEIATRLRVSDDTLRRALGRLDFVWKRPRYDLEPDPQLGGEKSGASAGKSVPCRAAASSWPRTRPTCCCSRRSAPPGPGAASRPGSG